MKIRYPTLIFPLPDYLANLDLQTPDFPAFQDPLRQQTLLLTPEEWVRQHLLNWLINGLGYPAGLLRLEFSHAKGRMKGRSDILVFDRLGNALLLAECKAAKISLSQSTIGQAAGYNITLAAPFLLITNGLGLACYWFDKNTEKYKSLRQIPSFEQALEMSNQKLN